ncbi:hypothetical protein [Streptomyces sp. N2A]|uniref:hypothetical protein n=1 Tax=Streptomyces sp. N2A TaxID=3073936 RepID=UPI00286FE680|nr:hypothetical protein [Streptomyces sp. N2A]
MQELVSAATGVAVTTGSSTETSTRGIERFKAGPDFMNVTLGQRTATAKEPSPSS